MAKRLKEQTCMYRKEFATALAERLDTEKEAADKIITAFFSVLTDTWSEGRAICFPNIGVFEVQIITEKMGRNPRTMKEHLIPASYKPAFRPTKELRDKISRSIQENAQKDTAS